MPHPHDRVFSTWLQQRRVSNPLLSFSIALEHSCHADQPCIGDRLAQYLNEFDDHSNGSDWLPITGHRLEKIQALQDFRYLVGEKKAADASASRKFLGAQGFVILEMDTCHEDTCHCNNVFQVSINCRESEKKSHHLWLNTQRIQTNSLVPMIANSFLDWTAQAQLSLSA